MAIHGDGDGTLTAIQEDSANHDQQADGDPYIVFGYGSLLFRVRFLVLCVLSPLGLTKQMKSSTFSHGWTDGCMRCSPRLTLLKRVRTQLVLFLSFSLFAIWVSYRARSPGPAPINVSHHIASHRIAESLRCSLSLKFSIFFPVSRHPLSWFTMKQ